MLMKRRRLVAVAVALLVGSTLGASSHQASVAEAALPLEGIVIVLDPGHNGGNAANARRVARLVWTGTVWRACGTTGTRTVDGYAEHRFNWDVALRTRARLVALGATVHLTRPSNTGWGPCVDVRGRFGTRVGAHLTVSIHADGSASSNRGFYVMRPALIKGLTDDIYQRSAALATAIKTGLLDADFPLANYYAGPTGIRTRSDFATFNLSNIPVVMVELGNMKNAADARWMKSPTVRERYSLGLVLGIRGFLAR
jgi:N-acetylmuramoyl-L-alanine amidase